MYPDFTALREALERNGQSHILANIDENDVDQYFYLMDLFSALNIDKYCESVNTIINTQCSKKIDCIPPERKVIGYKSELSPDQLDDMEKIGFQALLENKVAILLLSGGQGTRLGFDHPKGMYNVNLPSQKTLFQLQAERLTGLIKLVERKFSKKIRIQWYIMTSDFTYTQTKAFFTMNNFFGFPKDDVFFFEQYTVPSVSFEGKMLMKTATEIARSPDGNGGIYRALRQLGVLKHMEEIGIEYIHTYCVDNILVRLADPDFIGFCVKNGVDCAAKTVEKVMPNEGLGVIGQANNRYQIIEYSEIPQDLAEARDPKDPSKLLFHCGSICIHFFTRSFLERMASEEMEAKIPFHMARKVIPVWDGEKTVKPETPNGIKLEKFIFDVFPFAEKFAIWEVNRKDDFSALKNGPSKTTECPQTSRKSLLDLHRRYAEKAGAIFNSPDDIIEIDPQVSVFGENLDFLKGIQLSGVTRIILGDNDKPQVVKDTS